MQKNQVAPRERFVQGIRLGGTVPKGDTRLLHLSNYTDLTKTPPDKTNFWPKRTAFKPRSFGNIDLGDCTRAKQAWAILRMERLEQKSTVDITDEEVIHQYTVMENDLYGGGDQGAFEMDALNYWRREDKTIRDTKGRPYTIDAFTNVNQKNIVEFKNSLALSAAHGLAVTFALPFNWSENPEGTWDLPDGQQPIGPWQPGSWGYHSMLAIDYDSKGVYLDSTWNLPVGLITWKAFATYSSECYSFIDSIDKWRKTKGKLVDLDGLKKDVNRVSSVKIK
jgi:hypothetical protein